MQALTPIDKGKYTPQVKVTWIQDSSLILCSITVSMLSRFYGSLKVGQGQGKSPNASALFSTTISRK